jgi:hypothetical protein
MLKVTVKSTDLRPRTKRATGEIFAHEQTAYLWLLDEKGKQADFPEKITLTIWQRNGQPEHAAYPPGDYELSPQSFRVGDYGSITVSPRLVPARKLPAQS